jgi:hypothetical protein
VRGKAKRSSEASAKLNDLDIPVRECKEEEEEEEED